MQSLTELETEVLLLLVVYVQPPSFFIYFYFICHTIITKNIGKEEKRSGEET